MTIMVQALALRHTLFNAFATQAFLGHRQMLLNN
jgi:hypothetical protein